MVFLIILIWNTSIQAEQDSFIIGVEKNEYLPYYSPTHVYGYTGIIYEVLIRFAEDKNYNFVFKPMLVPELCTSLEAGIIDFKVPYDAVWRCPGLDKSDVTASNGFIPYVDGILGKPENSDKNISELKTIGTITGFTPVGFMDLINSGKLRLVEFNKSEELIKHTISGKIDIAYLNIDVGAFILRRTIAKPDALKYNPNLSHLTSTYRIATKKYPDIITEFNRWVEKNKKRIEYIASNYGIVNLYH